MFRHGIFWVICFLSSIGAGLGQTTTTPAWTAAERDVVASSALGQRLSPDGPVDASLPEGFRGYSDTASAGFGTFQIALPEDWSAWTIGMGMVADPLVQVFADTDPARAEGIERLIRHNLQSGAFKLRAMFAIADDQDAGIVQVSILGWLQGDGLDHVHEHPESFYRRFHTGDLKDAVWFDHHRSRSLRTTSLYASVSRISIDYFILEEANGMLWNLRCAFPRDREGHYRDLCDDIVETFAAGPFIISADDAG